MTTGTAIAATATVTTTTTTVVAVSAFTTGATAGAEVAEFAGDLAVERVIEADRHRSAVVR